MNIKVRSLKQLSDWERNEMRARLAWMLGESGEQWNEDHWLVMFENNALTLGFLVDQNVEPVVLADEMLN